MSIALTDDHKALADTASELLTKRDARGANRALLEAADEPKPAFWDEVADLGWLGLHVPEEHGGSGFGLPELVVVVEELGRAIAPGPVRAHGDRLGGVAAAAPGGRPEAGAPRPGRRLGHRRRGPRRRRRRQRRVRRRARPCVVGGGLADLLLVRRRRRRRAGRGLRRRRDRRGPGQPRPGPPVRPGHPRRRAGRGPARRRPGAGRPRPPAAGRRGVGVAHECTDQAAAYAKEREQFGRPIAMFQAVKHHCANMLVATELSTAAVWDAARAAADGGDEVLGRGGHGRHHRPAGGRRVRQPEHPGPRRHRLHLGARRPPLPAPGHGHRRRPRRRGRRRGRRRPDPPGREGDPRTSSCRPRPSPSATRSGPSPSASRTCRRRTSAPS